jgi:hypothetical protein
MINLYRKIKKFVYTLGFLVICCVWASLSVLTSHCIVVTHPRVANIVVCITLTVEMEDTRPGGVEIIDIQPLIVYYIESMNDAGIVTDAFSSLQSIIQVAMPQNKILNQHSST